MSASFWWVNHSRTCRYEVDGGFLWFGRKTPKSKARSESDKNTRRLLPADVIFSFADGAVGAIGVVLGAAREAPRPSEFASSADDADADTGWLVPVRFMTLSRPLRTEDRAAELAPSLPRKHSPILASGASNIHMPLAAVPPPMVEALRRLLAGEIERVVETITEAVGRGLADDAAEATIQQRTDIGPTQKADLLKARQGQGMFRVRVELNEHSCRITGVLDRRHLRAVHIKPWCECDDGEKLDGSNGLLMSPHLAHLFGRGYVSFSDSGELLVSNELNPVVLENWRIDPARKVGSFNPEQCRFLEFHRCGVFQQHGGGRRQKGSGNPDLGPVPLNAEPAIVHPA